MNQLPIGVGFKTAENAGLLRENAARGVRVQAWSPLRTLGPKAKAACGEIGAAKGGKSAQQVALRWLLQVSDLALFFYILLFSCCCC